MKKTVVANWKMHGSLTFIRDWLAASILPVDGCEIAICPPLPYLGILRNAQKVPRMQKVADAPTPMMEPFISDDAAAIGDFIGKDKQRDLEDFLNFFDIELSPQEAKVLHMCLNIDTDSEHMPEEVGQQFTVIRERIRQIKIKALRKMKEFKSKHLLPSAVLLGAQNIAAATEDGAYTGEVSARMLAEAGCQLAIIGHSERRIGQHENDSICAAKMQAAVSAGLRPLLCVGESASVRDSGIAAAIKAVLAQLDAALTTAAENAWQRLIIAYEPVWAIGSGTPPSREDINSMHNAIRDRLIEKTEAFGDKITLLYGGSVNAKNAAAFLDIENVNGLLVGGASLSAKEFNIICNLATSS